MCGRFTIHTPFGELKKHFGLINNINFPATYNACPSQELPIIVGNEIRLAKWAFIPHWATGKDMKPQINARSETAHEKPFFRDAFKGQRCIVPVDGFYEWKKVTGGKQPWYLYGKGIMGIAGLYNEDTFCLLTKEADGFTTEIHSRMPVIIPPDRYGYWSSCDSEDARRLIRQCNGDQIAGYKVSTRVNSPANNDESLLEQA